MKIEIENKFVLESDTLNFITYENRTTANGNVYKHEPRYFSQLSSAMLDLLLDRKVKMSTANDIKELMIELSDLKYLINNLKVVA